jgi:hypothetical protein
VMLFSTGTSSMWSPGCIAAHYFDLLCVISQLVFVWAQGYKPNLKVS